MLAYSIKSVIFLGMMYIPYMLMLRKESFFHFNRILLICIMLLSLILPLCDFHSLYIDNNPIQEGMTTIVLPTVTIGAEKEMPVSDSINWINAMLYIYIIGIIITALWKLVQICLLYKTIHSCVLWKEKQNGITIYCHAQDIAPFSWFNTIVISENDYQNNAKEILRHEIGHIIHRHSFDILLVNIIETIQWWNPLSWILASSLRDVHEYEADDEVLTSGVNIKQYQMLLIRKAVGSSSYAFANSFNHSLLKKRITMMLKSKSNPWMRTKALYIIPVATIALSVFATPELNNRVSTISEVAQTTIEGKGTNNSAISQVSEPEIVAAKKKTPEMANDDKEKVLYQDRMAEILKRKMQMEKEKAAKASEARPEANHNQERYSNIVFNVAEVMPEYPGGMKELMGYLANSLKFPEIAKEEDVAARVLVQFVIGKDGSINDVNTVHVSSEKKISEKCKQALISESEKAVSNMPNWTPGKQNGEDVAVKYILPITYRQDFPKAPQETEKVEVNLKSDK
jgi:outer membrane biosynthesis protein TonB